MRIINAFVYVLLFLGVILSDSRIKKRHETIEKWSRFLKKHLYIWGLLMAVNTISLAMTFVDKNQDIYVEKSTYGEEETEIPFLLQEGEKKKEIQLHVSARRLTADELQKKVKEAFSYLEDNMKGDNESLEKIYTNLDYSLDKEQFPFDAEFISQDYAIVDAEGIVNNEKQYLLSLGFAKQEIEKGIPMQIDVTLWYGQESFHQSFPLKIYGKKMSDSEEKFAKVEEFLASEEKKALYDEGFYVPNSMNEVQISRMDEVSITPSQVLLAGIIFAFLLFLREKENERKRREQRKKDLIRSYPWFVNEMVLLLGAGMQVRNIIIKLMKDYKSVRKEGDYREPLMEEISVIIHAMELGMTEEQAYYKLGRRLGIPCYIKIMTLLEQNVKRGGKGLIVALEQEDVLALEERKNLAKRYGEEAGTKLLGPMILLLLVVMLMIMIPALWGFVS